jgi:serine/threonine protein kinase
MRMDPAAPSSGDDASDAEVTMDDERTLARAVPPSPSSNAGAGKKPPTARRCPTCQQAFSGEARFCPFDGDALEAAPDWNPAADPLIGQVVDGRYEVTAVIGEGGMGTVYEVRHATLGRRFALKVLRRDIADAEHTARFIQEAKAAAAIGHPNIVAVSDFGELAVGGTGPGAKHAPPVPYFVMEYLSGISLAQLLRAEKTIDPARAAELVLQCASGLAAAHAAGVIHRDLKPDNVFLIRNGDREFVKLLDFGVAKMAGAGRLTRAGMVFGTPHYMSPEQAAGQSVDHRADVYALGVILYECLTSKVPFEADTYMGVLTKHMFATPEPIDRAAPDASRLGPFGAITMRCLSKAPGDRYASMAELVSALETALEDSGRTSGRGDRSGRARSRSRSVSGTPGLRPVVGPVGIGLGVVVVLVVGVLAARELRGGSVEAATPPVASGSAVASGNAVTTAAPMVTGTGASPSPSTGGTTAVPVVTATAAPVDTGAVTASSAGTGKGKPAGTSTGARPVRNDGPRKGKGSGELIDPWNK